MTQQLWWFATRSAGLMTWASATASVIVGLLLASRVLGRRRSGPWLLDLHRYLGALTVVFLAVHLVTLWADSYVHFGWAELLVPGASAWRTGAVAWGIIAAWILVIVEASSLLEHHLPRRLWHSIHLGSFAVMVMGTLHGWQAGSDVGNVLVTVVALVLSVGVVGLSVQRLRLRARAAAARAERQATLAQLRASSSDPRRTAARPAPVVGAAEPVATRPVPAPTHRLASDPSAAVAPASPARPAPVRHTDAAAPAPTSPGSARLAPARLRRPDPVPPAASAPHRASGPKPAPIRPRSAAKSDPGVGSGSGDGPGRPAPLTSPRQP